MNFQTKFFALGSEFYSHFQGRSQPNTAGERGRKNFRWSQICIIFFYKV